MRIEELYNGLVVEVLGEQHKYRRYYVCLNTRSKRKRSKYYTGLNLYSGLWYEATADGILDPDAYGKTLGSIMRGDLPGLIPIGPVSDYRHLL